MPREAPERDPSTCSYQLPSSWCVYYDKVTKGKAGFVKAGEMQLVYHFDTVKSFWGLYHRLELEKMPVGANLRCFKDDIGPVWEDEVRAFPGCSPCLDTTTSAG